MKEMHRFACTLCGECCSGNMKVFLNSYDLYKMGRFLKLSHTKELFEKNRVEWAIGQNGLELPKIRFKTYPFRFCPFLINDYREGQGLLGLCSLHPDHKPLVCHLAPLTRQIDLEEGTDAFGFVPPHPACPGCGQGEPLREENVRVELKKELDLELLYYKKLAEAAAIGQEDVKYLFLFELDRPFFLLTEMEEAAKGPTGTDKDCRGK